MHSRTDNLMPASRPLDPDTRGFFDGAACALRLSLLAWLCIGVAIAWAWR